MQLSDQQRDAVEYMGTPALVIAGAGSGKTRTLTAKIAHLVSKGYEPERILAITFTNKAADEMKSRLVHLTGISPSGFPWVRTYHSACFRILKEHCELLGYHLPIQIYSDYQQKKILTEIVVEHLNFDKKNVPAVLSAISKAKNSGEPGKYFDHRSGISHIRLDDVYTLYEKKLKEKNAVDFDNILFLTRNILRDYKDVRKKYQDFFRFILVDEYQDSNNLQEELTRLLLRKGNLFCVGDDWQSIYGFRGSNLDHFLTFRDKYNDARVFKLEENYRSVHEIVRISNELIGFNDKRMKKECFSEQKGGIVELHGFFSEDEEAKWVGRKVASLNDAGISHDKMAVLYRTKFCSRAFEKAFRYMKIPYRMLGSRGFFERKEILDINCYLIASIFKDDDVAFERILNIPKRGIGPGTLQKIQSFRTGSMSLQGAAIKMLAENVFPKRVQASLGILMTILDEINEMQPADAIKYILDKCRYLDYLKQYSNTEADYLTRVENIDELVYSASSKQVMIEYLEEAALIREDKKDEKNSSGVVFSTVHASKGLEYDTVFIAGCEEDLFPHWKSKTTDAELQEERRLMYVAVTRAKRNLYLSHAMSRRGQVTYMSRFLDEIEKSLYR
ncbi:MAG: ATP-dependent helicase [Deltaproteobacteria bacterium]|nr:ATP-dependent helicase [Deltaproteobacteria bacterium]MBW2218249.1 ATP-dependent helicase [Deltaproteobacteria bacterium]